MRTKRIPSCELLSSSLSTGNIDTRGNVNVKVAPHVLFPYLLCIENTENYYDPTHNSRQDKSELVAVPKNPTPQPTHLHFHNHKSATSSVGFQDETSR